ncbi:MAG: inositol monophosphatase family protein [Actinomycetota bacterium]
METLDTIEAELAFALELADAADAVALPRFRAGDLVVERKPDLTPVTDADRATERALIEILADERSSHGVLGEEFGISGEGRWQWILDPIDGTMNFVRGIPVWATLIALVHDGDPILGVVSAPSLHRRWWAGRGLGAFMNGEPISISGVEYIEDAQVSLGAEGELAQAGWGAGTAALNSRAWRVRGFGDFWSHMLVAEGAADIALDAGVKAWDMAAVLPIVEESGGRFTDLGGRRDYTSGSGLSTNGLLHDEVVSLFRR